MTHLSLFSGIGGLDLAAEWAGFETVGQCEWAEYPTKVLEKHWPEVPRWRDIRTLTKESFYERTGLHTVDVVSGGFPCQPFSAAGKRRGKEDDRYLWPEMLRVISEIRPRWVVGENVAGIVNLALDTVLSDLEASGYTARAVIIPACGVDAPHRRDRVAIVAYRNSRGARPQTIQPRRATLDNGICGEVRRLSNDPGICGVVDGLRTDIHETAADAGSIMLQGCRTEPLLDASFTNRSSREREREAVPQPVRRTGGTHAPWENWPTEPDVGRVADGVPHRVDRLKCLGNAVVPQQFYPIFAAIAELEGKHADD